jgi:hypothetical protein
MACKRLTLPLLIASLYLAIAAPLQACGLDGVPSISANGVLAHRNGTRASVGHLAQWAQFNFTTAFPAGKQLTFRENVAELHRSLLPQAFGKPWRWNMGDGTTLTGYSISHIYKRPGTYKVIVSAYYSDYRTWSQFDDVMVHVATGQR